MKKAIAVIATESKYQKCVVTEYFHSISQLVSDVYITSIQ